MRSKKTLFFLAMLMLVILVFPSCIIIYRIPGPEGIWKRTYQITSTMTGIESTITETFYFYSNGVFAYERTSSVYGRLEYCEGTYSTYNKTYGYEDYYVILYYSGRHFEIYDFARTDCTEFKYVVQGSELVIYDYDFKSYIFTKT